MRRFLKERAVAVGGNGVTFGYRSGSLSSADTNDWFLVAPSGAASWSRTALSTRD
jgi:hypothetical protein